jgi:hypothetical protein
MEIREAIMSRLKYELENEREDWIGLLTLDISYIFAFV